MGVVTANRRARAAKKEYDPELPENWLAHQLELMLPIEQARMLFDGYKAQQVRFAQLTQLHNLRRQLSTYESLTPKYKSLKSQKLLDKIEDLRARISQLEAVLDAPGKVVK